MAITDKFKKGESLFFTTLSAGISTGTGETITLASVSGLPTDTEITLTFDRVDADGVATATKTERITGTISGSTLISYTRGTDGSTEQAHSADAVVEYVFNSQDLNDIIDGILVAHAQSGHHTITIADGGNTTGITVAQNDVTNNPAGIIITNAGTGDGLFIDQNGEGRAIDIDTESTTLPGIYVSSQADGTVSGVQIVKEVGATGRGLTVQQVAGGAQCIYVQNLGTDNGIFINQDGNGVALNIDTEATSAISLQVYGQNTTNYMALIKNEGIMVASGNRSVLGIIQEHASSTAHVLNIRNDGTGNGLLIDQDGNGTALDIDTEVANDGIAMTIAVAGTSPQPFSVYRNDDVTGNTVLRLGSGYMWVDATGDVRVHTALPGSDTAGTIIGTQS